MVKTASTMLPLGTMAPDFILEDTITKQKIHLSSYTKDFKGFVIIFICNHCPYVKHINKALVELTTDYQDSGIGFIAINSNDPEMYPDDSPSNMALVAKEEGYQFPYLFDSTQELAQAMHAACTPDFFIFNAHKELVYRGQFDDSRPGNLIPPTGADLRHAIDCILEQKINEREQKPSLGCNIKWKT
jgi:hypothetical protein